MADMTGPTGKSVAEGKTFTPKLSHPQGTLPSGGTAEKARATIMGLRYRDTSEFGKNIESAMTRKPSE